MCIGVLTIFVMCIWPKRLASKIPGSLAALGIVLLFNAVMQWDVAVVGAIPKSLVLSQRLELTRLTAVPLSRYVLPALSIASLAMIESLLCGASAGKMKHERMDADREIVAQGIGNLIVPFFGGIPATAAIARTSVAIKSGGVTRLTGILHAAFLFLSMFLLSPVMSRIPLAALAGILLVTAWRMNDWENMRFIFEHRYKSGMAKYAVTMLATVFLDLTQAIVIGVLFSVMLIVVKLTQFQVDTVNIDRKRLEKMGISLSEDMESGCVKVAYLTGNLFFGVSNKLRCLGEVPENTCVLIISMRGVPLSDLSGIQCLMEVVTLLHERGVRVLFSSLQPKILNELRRAGIEDVTGNQAVFSTADEAILYAEGQLN